MATESDLLFLAQLRRPGSAAQGWSHFVERYSGLLLQVARKYATDHDETYDRYLYVCERLAEDDYRRLGKFTRGGEREFCAWLRAVARNLCIDYLRQQKGRRRLPKAIARLPELDRQIFELTFWEGRSAVEVHGELGTRRADLELSQVLDCLDRLHAAIRPWQHAQMVAPRPDAATADDERIVQMTDDRVDAVEELVGREQLDALAAAMAELPATDRLIVRLRFEKGLTFEQIATAAGLGDYRKAHQRLAAILASLRKTLKGRGFLGTPE